ncbi:MAG: peroxiredoxin family protein [Acidobacteriota bacterium]
MRNPIRPLCALALFAAACAGQDFPKPAPELKLQLTSGQEFQLSSLKGKVVALEFIFTTCPHCQQLCQTTNKLLPQYLTRGFRAVAIACNDGAEWLAPEFARQFNLAYPVGIGNVPLMFSFVGMPPKQFRLPQLVFVDRKGMIRARYTGEDAFFNEEETSMRKAIEQYLDEGAPVPAKSRRAK